MYSFCMAFEGPEQLLFVKLVKSRFHLNGDGSCSFFIEQKMEWRRDCYFVVCMLITLFDFEQFLQSFSLFQKPAKPVWPDATLEQKKHLWRKFQALPISSFLKSWR